MYVKLDKKISPPVIDSQCVCGWGLSHYGVTALYVCAKCELGLTFIHGF